MVWDVSASKSHVCADPTCTDQVHRARPGTGRRRVLAGLAAAGAATLLPAGALFAQAPAAKRNLIDVHHHYFPPELKAAAQAFLDRTGGGRQLPMVTGWTPEKTLEDMDKGGTSTAILSLYSVPANWYGLEAEGAQKLARICNDYAARMMSDHRGRFGLFAAVPMPHIEVTLKEIEYAFDTLKADGINFSTSFGDKWPGDPIYNPVWEELNRRKAIAYFHPYAPNCCGGGLVANVPESLFEYPYDTGRAVLSLLFNGTLAKYRDIKWLFSQAGGPVPMLAGRVVTLTKFLKNIADVAPQGVDYELQRLYYETANSAYAPTMAALLKYVPLKQVLFGTDFPYVSTPQNAEGLEKIGLSAEELAAIQRGNAMQLIPRLKA
jgi:6-methylsalicylate decarboxylase